MSTPYAVAAVTAVLQGVLNEGFKAFKVSDVVNGNVLITAEPPDRVPATGNDAKNQVNLFLYRVTPNPGWSNLGLPVRDANGGRVASPPLALDLHYMLTAYGNKQLHAEIVLGHAMHLLYEAPFLTRDAIRTALNLVTPAEIAAALKASQLADQVEQIKLSAEPMSTDETSKLWAAFQAPYRPSAAYLATVVLVEGRRPARPSLPVRERNLYVLPFRQPVIDEVVAEDGKQVPIQAGTALLVHGRELRGSPTGIRIGDVDVTAAATAVEPERIRLVLPDPLPAGVPAGVQAVYVVHPVEMGTPPVPHPGAGAESNAGAFVLRPRVKTPPLVDGAAKEIEVQVHPDVLRDQRTVLLLNSLDPAPPGETPRGYTLPMRPLSPGVDKSAKVRFSHAGVKAGKYLLRVRVDGAESWPEMVAGVFAKPEVTL